MIPLDPIETLEQLVAIPSVNPMGRTDAKGMYGEAALTDHLEKLFARLGLPTLRQPVLPGRENLLACLKGDMPPGRHHQVVLLDAHQDTVPVEGMTIEPFHAVQREGRLYGRGACDTKGGMAAMLAAVSRLAAELPRGRPTVLVGCTVNEEHGFSGVKRLVESWTETGKPDVALVAEPTGLDAVIAHKGVMRWRCHARGKAAHSPKPEAGDNAIYRMAAAITAIERYAQGLSGRGTHPLCGPATLSVGTIHGGTSVNTVPARATIEIDLRPMPGNYPEAARQELIDYLASDPALAGHLEHDPSEMTGLSLEPEPDGLLVRRLSTVVQDVVGNCRQLGVPYATNAAFYAAAGVPSVVFGPGQIAQAHTADEWVAIEQVRQAAEIFYRFCREAF